LGSWPIGVAATQASVWFNRASGFKPLKKKGRFSEAAFFVLCCPTPPSRIAMKNTDLNAKSIEELWAIHEEIASILFAKMEAEKLKVQKRLDQLGMRFVQDLRRPYPEVRPKFRNPNPPYQTWAGRGKQPKWITQFLD
jgi:DNA-binding protein H-NS